MDLTRFLMLRLQGAAPDTPIFNKSDSPNPPAAPDPSKQVAAEAAANRVNVKSPFGSVTYTPSTTAGASPISFDEWMRQSYPTGLPQGEGGSIDPSFAQGQYQQYVGQFMAANPGSTSYTQNIELSPQEQALYQGRNAVSQALLMNAGATAGKLPAGFQFDGATDPTTNQFFTAQKALLDPVFDRETAALDQKLANQGLPTGDEGNPSAADYERSQLTKAHDAAYEQAAANALGQGFNQALSARQQNYNEIAAALNGSQLNVPGSTASPLDVSSAFANQQAGLNRQYQGQLAGYQSDVGQTNTGIAAAATVAAAFI